MPNKETDKLIRKAIAEGRLIEVVYHNKRRTVEPHDYGILNGTAKLLAYQLVGETTGHRPNWRMMNVAEIESVRILDRTFSGSRGPSGKPHEWEELFARVKPITRSKVTKETARPATLTSRMTSRSQTPAPRSAGTKQHIHRLVDKLAPAQLAAIEALLFVMVEPIRHSAMEAPPDDEALDAHDIESIRQSEAWFRKNRGMGIPMEEVLAEFDLSMKDFPPAEHGAHDPLVR